MDRGIDQLTVEVHKIVTAPVAVSLKKLHSILDEHRENCEPLLRQWTSEHQDQIFSLASTVVHAVPRQPYVLEIIERLSCERVLRNAILDASPAFLDEVLSKAVEGDCASEQHRKLCLRLLQEPLEHHVALPRSAEKLLSSYFTKVEQEPCLATAEPIYTLLDGACEEILGILPQDGLETFQRYLMKIMRSANSMDMNEQLLHIICLAITSKLTRSCLSSSCSRPENDVKKLFAGDKAAKTIHLVALQVIYACRSESLPEYERLKRVRLARQILEAVDVELRLSWIRTNPKIHQKLQERLLNSTLPTAVQVEAFAFLALLSSKEQDFSAHLIKTYQEALLKLLETTYCNTRLTNALTISIPVFARHMQDSFWRSFILLCIEQASKTNQNPGLSNDHLLEMLRSLEDNCMHCPVTRKRFIAALATVEVSSPLERFLSQCQDNVEVTRVLCASISRIGAASSQDETTFPSSLLLKLITKLQECSYGRPDYRNRRANYEKPQKSGLNLSTVISDDNGASRHWRERLAFDLETEARHRQDSIVRFVGQVCHDFETRCENVEKPLREKIEERDELEEALHCVEARAVEAQKETEMLKRQISTLEAAYAQLEDAHKVVNAEVDNLNKNYQDLSEIYQQSKYNSERALLTAHDDFESQKLELKAKITDHMEKLDENSSEIYNLNSRLIALESEFEEQRARSEELQRSLQAANAALAASEALAKSLAQEKENLIESSRSREKELTSDVENMRVEYQKLSNHMAQTNKEHSATLQAQQDTLKRVHEDYDVKIKNLDTKTATEYNALEKTLQDTKHELIRAHETHQIEIQRQLKEQRDLQKELDRYMEECREKEIQLCEAQMMKSRLLTAMGLKGGDLSLGEDSRGETSDEHVLPRAETRKLRSAVRDPSTPSTPAIPGEDERLGNVSKPEIQPQSTRRRLKPRTVSYQAGSTTRGIAAGGPQSLLRGRERHSMDLQRLGTASANRLNRLNQQNSFTSKKSSRNQRKTEDMNLYDNSMKDQLFGSDAGTTETNPEQVSDGAAPGAIDENIGISSASEFYFDGLGTEDFDETTVEL